MVFLSGECSLLADYRGEHPTQTGVPIAALEHYAHYYPPQADCNIPAGMGMGIGLGLMGWRWMMNSKALGIAMTLGPGCIVRGLETVQKSVSKLGVYTIKFV